MIEVSGEVNMFLENPSIPRKTCHCTVAGGPGLRRPLSTPSWMVLGPSGAGVMAPKNGVFFQAKKLCKSSLHCDWLSGIWRIWMRLGRYGSLWIIVALLHG